MMSLFPEYVNYIKNYGMPAFLARKHYCHTCMIGFDKITDHPCGDLCKLCKVQNCPIVNWIYCTECNRFFKSDVCFTRQT